MRQPIRPRQRRTAWLRVRLTPAERAALEAYARDSGVALSDAVRLGLRLFLERTRFA